MSTYLHQWTVFTYFRLQANIPGVHTIYSILSWPYYLSNSSSNFCFHFSSGQGEAEARSRRSLASAGGDQGPGHYDDHHPPNITPVGGVPNLKVISHQSIRD